MKRLVAYAAVSAVYAVGCSSESTDGTNDQEPDDSIILDPDAGTSNGNGVSGAHVPEGFTHTDLGGYKLGAPVPEGNQPDAPSGGSGGSSAAGGQGNAAGSPNGGAGGDASSDAGCGTVLTGIVRDFREQHPDFEFEVADDTGFVGERLGENGNPTYVGGDGTKTTNGAATFEQWYTTIDEVNKPYYLHIALVPNGGVFTFESNAFFPLDGSGFGNEGNDHNFHFTFELHTAFKYNGGEVFKFIGDDDVFVYINRQLALDLGGVHKVQEAEVNLDAKAKELGLTVGSVYEMALFHAERHTTESNFRIDTTMEFVDCGEPVLVR